MQDFVNVCVRIKPSFTLHKCLEIISKQPDVNKYQSYHFDHIFTQEQSQDCVYAETVKPLVEKAKIGYNCTVFAYGQTGTGKTYTIGTSDASEQDQGLIVRTLRDFFAGDSQEIQVSFMEIYNEKVYDLLSETKAPLAIKGFAVQDLTRMRVFALCQALQWLKFGAKKRHIGETRQNSNSSRSHAIFSIYCTNGQASSKLNLVDLAGSESVKKTGNQGFSLHEGININRGLLSLGQVMTALSANLSHIPYRQSVVTTVLKDSLDKTNYVSLIACISPDLDDLQETLQTLDFAQRVKRIRNKPEINEVISSFKQSHRFRGTTPFKPRNALDTPYKTPMKKPEASFSLDFMESTPLLSSSMKSENQPSFSPILRRHLTKFEETLMGRVEETIKKTLDRRQSVRLLEKNSSPKENAPKNSYNEATTDEKAVCSFVFKVPASTAPTRRKSVRLQQKESYITDGVQLQKDSYFSDSTRRRSVRLQNRLNASAASPNSPKKRKKSPCRRCNAKKPKLSNESPMTRHTASVLRVLNTGTRKELEKLATIGPKTADSILLFRQIRGEFKSIKDLAEMPRWSNKQFQKFVDVNFLKI